MSTALVTLPDTHALGRVTHPYRVDLGVVRARVHAYLDRGVRDPSLVAVNTATLLFGDHPEGGRAMFPPWPRCRPEVRCVFDLVVAEVQRALLERGLDPADPSPGVVLEWRVVASGFGSPDVASYPWEFPALQIDGFPAPSAFCRVDPHATDVEFFRALLATSLEMAGVSPDLAFDNDSKVARRLRKDLRDLVVAAPFNDQRVTSSSATLAGGRDPGALGPTDPGVTHVLGPHGRGLVWRSWHYDDLDRIARGLPPKRGVTYEGQTCGSGRSPMTLWVPAIRLAALRGPAPAISLEGMSWSDGSSTLEPPPVVRALGVDHSNCGLGGAP